MCGQPRHRASRSLVRQMHWTSCGILQASQHNSKLSCDASDGNSAVRPALSGLLFLACLRHPPEGKGHSASSVQSQYDHQVAYQRAINAIADAFKEQFLGVLLANALMAWHVIMTSGLTDMKLPLRYVVDCEGHKLDCSFEIPLIGMNDDEHQAGLSVAKLAALQVR